MSLYPKWWLRVDGVPQELLDDWAERRAGDRDEDAETDARDYDDLAQF